MTVEQIGRFEVNYGGAEVPDHSGWTARVAITKPSANPMHPQTVFAEQRVLPESVFPDEKTAEAEARKAALALLEESHIA